MKTIADHVTVPSAARATGSAMSKHSTDHLPKRLKQSWIDALWTKLHAIYGAKWSDSYPGDMADMAKAEWAEALADLSGDQIRVGIERCRKLLKWPPMPAEFIAEAEAGMPSQHEVNRAAYLYREADKALPKAPDPDVLRKAAHDMQTHVKTGRTGQRRSLFSQHYGPAEYEKDIAKAREEGRPFYDVDMAAMAKNGWTEADEENWRGHMMALGHGINSMYARGHEPK